MAGRYAVVVGGGIGGLAAAAALGRAGWDVAVLERGAALEPVGAGISLWPNALRALDVLGVGDDVRTQAALGGGTGIRRPDGSWIGRSDVVLAVRDRFGDPLVVLARSELVDLLAELLPPGALRLGAHVEKVHPGDVGRPATVSLADGSRLEADLVVAADGVSSRVRSGLFPRHPAPTYAGYTTWRFLGTAPGDVAGSETWGTQGQRFAIVPMAAGRVYCYATATMPSDVRYADEAAELRRRFGAWHDPIPALLAGLRRGDVLHHDIVELGTPLPTFSVGRVALLGDAAHVMTPELGQGGCLALEDAVTLAALVRDAASFAQLTSALTRYTELRLPRTTRLARRSRRTGRVTQAAGPVGTRLRDLSGRLAGLLPPRVAVRGLDSIVDWSPPEA